MIWWEFASEIKYMEVIDSKISREKKMPPFFVFEILNIPDSFIWYLIRFNRLFLCLINADIDSHDIGFFTAVSAISTRYLEKFIRDWWFNSTDRSSQAISLNSFSCLLSSRTSGWKKYKAWAKIWKIRVKLSNLFMWARSCRITIFLHSSVHRSQVAGTKILPGKRAQVIGMLILCDFNIFILGVLFRTKFD